MAWNHAHGRAARRHACAGAPTARSQSSQYLGTGVARRVLEIRGSPPAGRRADRWIRALAQQLAGRAGAAQCGPVACGRSAAPPDPRRVAGGGCGVSRTQAGRPRCWRHLDLSGADTRSGGTRLLSHGPGPTHQATGRAVKGGDVEFTSATPARAARSAKSTATGEGSSWHDATGS